jgi:LVIVD repeat
MYADLYTDLVALDISNPLNVVKTKIIDNVFPHRYYNGFTSDSSKIIYDWVRHDTTLTVDCASNGWVNNDWRGGGVLFLSAGLASNDSRNGLVGGAPSGIAGSMARFALLDNYLYTVGGADLKVVDIDHADKPVVVNTINVSWGIETIYPFNGKLFIGSSNGMFIFNTQNPVAPVQLGTFSHARVCDPVIADGKYAYVTLRNGTQCQGFLNELDVVDISNLSAPVLLKKFDMTNPHGLSKDGDLLFICDGRDGLKVFDAKDATNIQLKKHWKNFETYDVIAYNGLAIVVAKDGLYQFDYNDLNNMKQLSKISITQ